MDIVCISMGASWRIRYNVENDRYLIVLVTSSIHREYRVLQGDELFELTKTEACRSVMNEDSRLYSVPVIPIIVSWCLSI